jgi:hypothetical protein
MQVLVHDLRPTAAAAPRDELAADATLEVEERLMLKHEKLLAGHSAGRGRLGRGLARP